MKYGLSQKVIDQINHVFKCYSDLEKVILYGSRAKGNFREGSDIDLTFIGNNLGLQQLSQISNDLDDILLPYQFNLSIYDTIKNQDLLNHIERVGEVFYQKS